MGIAERYESIAAELRQACLKAGRPEDAATLLAVSKTVGIDGVACAMQAGAGDFGENRPEQLMEKQAVFPGARWHFIGNIQSRRIRDIVPRAYLIHSLCQPKHAHKIDEEAARAGKVQNVLIEVNVSGEESKSGVTPEEVPGFLDACLGLANLRVCGLMTMAPQGNLGVAKDCFSRLACLRDELRETAFSGREDKLEAFSELSMGMSEDWREAVQEGATIVRLGRAIFGFDGPQSA